jgi:hypothetical protein
MRGAGNDLSRRTAGRGVAFTGRARAGASDGAGVGALISGVVTNERVSRSRVFGCELRESFGGGGSAPLSGAKRAFNGVRVADFGNSTLDSVITPVIKDPHPY